MVFILNLIARCIYKRMHGELNNTPRGRLYISIAKPVLEPKGNIKNPDDVLSTPSARTFQCRVHPQHLLESPGIKSNLVLTHAVTGALMQVCDRGCQDGQGVEKGG